MSYVMIVQASSYAVGDSFAIEGAFAHHLRAMKELISEEFGNLVLVSPQMSVPEYESKRNGLSVIDSAVEGIILIPAAETGSSLFKYWLQSLPHMILSLINKLPRHGVVQVDLATDIRRPTTLFAGLVAKTFGSKMVLIVDIDFRLHAKRNRKLGVWGFKKYIFNKYIQNTFKMLQIYLASKFYDLLLLKSAGLVDTFNNGKGNVHNFYDVVHSSSQVLDDSELLVRGKWLGRLEGEFRVCYFGRLVEYKGIDRIIEAVSIARKSIDVRLSIIGDGPMSDDLEDLAERIGVSDIVDFERQMEYGEQLFNRLSREDVSISTPLIEDTPRAAFDAMARGLPIVAFDTSYFRDLAEASGAVLTAEWPRSEAIAAKLIDLANDRGRLAEMAAAAVQFANDNTQEHWLQKRIVLVRKLCLS